MSDATTKYGLLAEFDTPADAMAAAEKILLEEQPLLPLYERSVIYTQSERLAGVEGCAHIKELLNVMPSAAFQSLTPVRRQRMAEQGTAVRPVMIDSCLAYSAAGPLVQKKWPQYFRKPDSGG